MCIRDRNYKYCENHIFQLTKQFISLECTNFLRKWNLIQQILNQSEGTEKTADQPSHHSSDQDLSLIHIQMCIRDSYCMEQPCSEHSRTVFSNCIKNIIQELSSVTTRNTGIIVNAVIEYIHKNYEKQIGLNDAAEDVYKRQTQKNQIQDLQASVLAY